jgi:hypothetical protein
MTGSCQPAGQPFFAKNGGKTKKDLLAALGILPPDGQTDEEKMRKIKLFF